MFVRISLETPVNPSVLLKRAMSLRAVVVKQFGVGTGQLISVSALGVRGRAGIDVEGRIGLQQRNHARNLLSDFGDDPLRNFGNRSALRFGLQQNDEETHRCRELVVLQSRYDNNLVDPGSAFEISINCF